MNKSSHRADNPANLKSNYSDASLKALPFVRIYTDGSSRGNPGPGGWGCVLEFDMSNGEIKTKELSAGFERTTNNRMEIRAALEGLRALTMPCKVDLYSDSSYLVNAFKQDWIVSWKKNGWKTSSKKPVKNKDLWLELDELLQIHQVSWHWVQGHAGHPQNERCDQLATSAADDIPNRQVDEGFLE